MKKFFYSAAFTSLALFSCAANEKPEINVSSLELEQVDDSTEVFQEYLGEKLNPIRTYVDKVDSIHNADWSLVTEKEFELGSEKVVATFYVWNSDLKRIKVVNQDVSKKGESHYYFKQNEIVYASEQSMKELGADGLVLFKNESFFEDGTLFRSFNNQDCGAPFNQEYRDEEQKRILGDLEIIRSAFQID